MTKLESVKYIEALYIEIRGKLYNKANYILKDPHLAEDAVQEAFARVLKWPNGLISTPKEKALSFMLCVCGNVVSDMQRKRGGIVLKEDIEIEAGSGFNPEELVISRESFEQIESAIYQLPEEYFTTFVFRRVFKLSEAETANLCGVKLATVKSRMQRIKAIMEKKLRGGEADE